MTNSPLRGKTDPAMVQTVRFGGRIIFGYLLSVILIVLSVIQLVAFHRAGDTRNMIYYCILVAFAVGYAAIVTWQMVSGIRKVGKALQKEGKQ